MEQQSPGRHEALITLPVDESMIPVCRVHREGMCVYACVYGSRPAGGLDCGLPGSFGSLHGGRTDLHLLLNTVVLRIYMSRYNGL